MVTKHDETALYKLAGSVLAKIFMVTKLKLRLRLFVLCSVLAKIFMVTKHTYGKYTQVVSSVLAKIFMVTKPDIQS